MKYDVEEYWNHSKTGDKRLYAITTDGKQVGLNLPDECESLLVAKIFLVWCGANMPSMIFTWVSKSCIEELFTKFLEQRKRKRLPKTAKAIMKVAEAEAQPAEPVARMASSLRPMSAAQLLWMEPSDKPDDFFIDPTPKAEEQPAEPEESAASEYAICLFVSREPPHKDRFRIEHLESSNLVPLTFETREDAEWFLDRWDDCAGYHQIHTQSLFNLEQHFKRYEADTEPAYVCPYGCIDSRISHIVEPHSGGDRHYLCCWCGGHSPYFDKDTHPHKLWMEETK